MSVEKTLSIIKPDAVRKNHIGAIIHRFETHGLKVAAMKMLRLTKEEAGHFYHVHREKKFFNDLTDFMSSGPVVVMILEGKNAVMANRDIMGATNPKEAKPGTIRKDFAESIDENAVHGSDSLDNARHEINFFFRHHEIFHQA
jgi:nucleoside-diphosphate kinase